MSSELVGENWERNMLYSRCLLWIDRAVVAQSRGIIIEVDVRGLPVSHTCIFTSHISMFHGLAVTPPKLQAAGTTTPALYS